MGLFSVLFRARDAPQNRTSGGAYSFFLGNSTSGKRVNERTSMQMTAVYSCVRILSEAVAGLPLHFYKYTEDGGKEKAAGHPLYFLLHDEPNPEMTSFVFRETLMTHLLLWGNAYAQIIRNGKGEVIGLYPLMPDRMGVERDSKGQLYYEYTVSMEDAPTVKGSTVILPPTEVLHIPGLGFDGLVGYSPIAMAKNAIGMAIACEECGDCVAAAQIYNMLSNYKGRVTVKIDGIAASAASVIAMAGDTVLVSPVSMLMIHNPATMAWGDHAEMQKAMDMLSEVKESIINAYVLKTGLSRPKLSHLMDAETWMDANKAVELGFADDIMARAKTEPEEGEGDTDGEEKKSPSAHSSMLFSRRAADNALLNKVIAKYGEKKPRAGIGEQAKIPAPGEKTAPETETGRSVDALMERLNLLKR